MMMRKSTRDNPDQLALFSTFQYERVITEVSIDCEGYEPNFSPVPTDYVERVKSLYPGIEEGDSFLFNTDDCDRQVQIVYQSLHGKMATIVSLNSKIKPGTIELEFDCGKTLYIKPVRLINFGWGKISPVPPKNKGRVYFWVEQYLVNQRYLNYRYCYLQQQDGIEQVVKIHIPGRGLSIRQGRAERVRDAIAEGLSPEAIALLIQEWKR